jgi:hypothetical protein
MLAPGRGKSQTVILKQDRKSRTVVEHSPHHLVAEGLNPAKAAYTGIEQLIKSFFKKQGKLH